MTLKDLLAVLTDYDEIQICTEISWDIYDVLNANSKLLKPFYDLKVKCLSAVDHDVLRVDLDWSEIDEQTN